MDRYLIFDDHVLQIRCTRRLRIQHLDTNFIFLEAWHRYSNCERL